MGLSGNGRFMEQVDYRCLEFGGWHGGYRFVKDRQNEIGFPGLRSLLLLATDNFVDATADAVPGYGRFADFFADHHRCSVIIAARRCKPEANELPANTSAFVIDIIERASAVKAVFALYHCSYSSASWLGIQPFFTV
jgi:hypothetical protein